MHEWLAYSAPDQFAALTLEQQQFVVWVRPRLPALRNRAILVDNVIWPPTFRLVVDPPVGLGIVYFVRETDGEAIICEFR